MTNFDHMTSQELASLVSPQLAAELLEVVHGLGGARDIVSRALRDHAVRGSGSEGNRQE